MSVKLPAFPISATVNVVGVVLNTAGVKLFSGIVGGGVEPSGTTVTSGLITLIIVPGVEAGTVETLAGINRTGIAKSVGSNAESVTEPEMLCACKPVQTAIKAIKKFNIDFLIFSLIYLSLNLIISPTIFL